MLSNIPATMQGVFVRRNGGSSQLEIQGQCSVPSMAADEVLLVVSATALTDFDAKSIHDYFPQLYPHNNTPGGSVSGVGTVVSGIVVDVGSAVTDVSRGQAMIGVLHPSVHALSQEPRSAVAQYVSLPRHALVHYLYITAQETSDTLQTPSFRTHAIAAALTGAMLSHVRCLPPPAPLIHLSPGALVVFIAGSTCSSLLPSLLAARGMRVLAACSTDAAVTAMAASEHVYAVCDTRAESLLQRVLLETGGVGTSWVIDASPYPASAATLTTTTTTAASPDANTAVASTASATSATSTTSTASTASTVATATSITSSQHVSRACNAAADISPELLTAKTAMLAASLGISLGNHPLVEESDEDEDYDGNYAQKILDATFPERPDDIPQENALDSDEECDSVVSSQNMCRDITNTLSGSSSTSAFAADLLPQHQVDFSGKNDENRNFPTHTSQASSSLSHTASVDNEHSKTHGTLATTTPSPLGVVPVADVIAMLAPGATLVLSRAVAFDIPETQQLLLRGATVLYNTPMALMLGGTSFMHIVHDVLALVDHQPPDWLKPIEYARNEVKTFPMTRVRQAMLEAEKGALVSITFDE